MDRSAGQPARSSQGSAVEIIIPILIKIYSFCFEPLYVLARISLYSDVKLKGTKVHGHIEVKIRKFWI